MGRSQAVRQRTLTPSFAGSSPAAPATSKAKSLKTNELGFFVLWNLLALLIDLLIIKAKADKFEEGHVFHSFRHTVHTEFRNNEANPEFVTRIQGWERGSSLSEHYGEVSLKVLRETVNCKLKYDGLDLSHLYRE